MPAIDLLKHLAQVGVPEADKVEEIGERDDAAAVGLCCANFTEKIIHAILHVERM